MTRALSVSLVLFVASVVHSADNSQPIKLFDGQSLAGWKVAEHPESIRVEDGVIVCDGPRAHAYYVGPMHNHDFKNFDLEAEAMTVPGASSGIFFQTEYQEKGFPAKGYEAQINNTHRTPKRTGSLYEVVNLPETSVKDNEWIRMRVLVEGKRIQIFVNGDRTVDYTEPDDYTPPTDRPGRKIASGTIALQCTDAASKTYFRNVQITPLP